MLSITIINHSPMDDYRKIQSQIRYTVQYAPFNDSFDAPDKPDRTESLTGSRSYKIFYGLTMRLLILTGVGIVASIAAGFLFSYDSSSELKRIIFIILIVASSAAFLIALLLSGIGAFIERCAEKKDREISISLDSKTWILDNGQVVISDEQKLRGRQKCDSKTILPIAEAPFKTLKMIQKVYSIARVDGRIVVDAQITELYREHPYTDDYEFGEDSYERVYYYRRRDRRDKVMWYENMYGRELLLQALKRLQQD